MVNTNLPFLDSMNIIFPLRGMKMKKILALTLMSFIFVSIFGCSNDDKKASDAEQENFLNEKADSQYSKDAEEKSRESRFKPSEDIGW